MVEWGILKKDFNVLCDEDISGEQATDVRKITSNPTTSSSNGGMAASVHGNHSSNGSIGQGFFKETNDVDKLYLKRSSVAFCDH